MQSDTLRVSDGRCGIAADAQLIQYFRIRLLHRQNVMAGGAVIRDRLSTLRHMAAIVTAEATRIVHVPDIVRIGSPGDFHIWKHILVVDRNQALRSLFDGCTLADP